MWEASFWVKQFPDLFPYGDGAYGLSRRRYLSLQQWAALMMTRTELDYIPAAEVPHACIQAKPCSVCLDDAPSGKRVQPRWSSHTSFRFVVYDCWRRSEIMKKAKMHVRKKGFQQNLTLIATTSAEHIRQAMAVVGSASSMHQIAVDERVDLGLRRALKARGTNDGNEGGCERIRTRYVIKDSRLEVADRQNGAGDDPCFVRI